MTDYINLFLQQLINTSMLEWVAVVFAIVYLLLAVKESVWCWPAAFISTGIYTLLFFEVNLYMESSLNIYYLLMAVYGWYQWQYKTQEKEVRPVVVWSGKVHWSLVLGLSSLVLISGFTLEQYTDQDFAYTDSFTTWFAVVTTYMVAQKVLENWIYWIIINSVSIYLYLQKGFVLTSLLFVSYLIIAVFGWYKWKQHYNEQIETA